MQLGDGSPQDPLSSCARDMAAMLVHLTALALAEAADVAFLAAFLEDEREVLAIRAHVAGLAAALARLADVLLAGLAQTRVFGQDLSDGVWDGADARRPPCRIPAANRSGRAASRSPRPARAG